MTISGKITAAMALLMAGFALGQATTPTPVPAPATVPDAATAAKETVTKSRWPTAADAIAASEGKKVRIILVGDSTMQVGSGYGPGFCALVTPDAACINEAKGGRSTGSYRAEGSWNTIMEILKAPTGVKATYVLIQFGHNDQPGKPGRSTDLKTEFPVNLKNYVDEARAAGAKPILVTALSRRSFKDGKIDNGLGPWADATKAVAGEEHIPLLDLNAESVAYLEKVGPEEADTLAMAPPPSKDFDHTHVGPKGAAIFGWMVANELVTAVPELKADFNLSR